MKKVFNIFWWLTFLTVFSCPANAHDFFVVATQSMTHPYGCATINIGWGHVLPLDDFLPAKRIETYAIYDPDLRKLDFPFDSSANNDITYENKGRESKNFPAATLQTGASFVQKVIFKENAPDGVYQVAGSLKKAYLTAWDDDKGKRHWNPKSLDKIKKEKKSIKNIEMSILFHNFAKSFITKGKWTQPKPVGHDLELIPLTDLSKVRVGDFVAFQVLLNGKPYDPKSIPPTKIFAYGEHYGLSEDSPDHYYGLWSNIHEGVGKICLTAPGRWVAKVFVREPVTKDGPFKDVAGKALEVGYIATATFTVK